MAHRRNLPVVLPRRLGPLVGGDDEDIPSLSLPPALITRADLPAIAAQATGLGRRITLGPVVEEGVLLCYGDYSSNTGPIDLIAVDAIGTATTLLDNLPTEEIQRYRVLNDGIVWTLSIDPQGAGAGFLATNHGGTWHTIEVAVGGLSVLEHGFDVAQEPNGDLYVCGSHLPDTAFVWKSTDDGATWTEALAYATGEDDGDNRFYGFGRTNGDLFVSRSSPGEGRYVFDGDEWTYTLDTSQMDNEADVFVGSTTLFRLDAGEARPIGTLPPAGDGSWTVALGLDGSSVYACDGESVWYLPDAT